METITQTKNYVTPETVERLCEARCKICNSTHAQSIQDLKKAGHSYLEIVDVVQKKLDFSISSAGLSRHFAAYNKRRELLTAEIMNTDLIEEATCRAYHNKELLTIIQRAFKSIKNRLDRGTLVLDISDLDKVMKLYYQIMNGEDTNEKDVLAIFQRATDKYGVDLQQGVLFKSP